MLECASHNLDCAHSAIADPAGCGCTDAGGLNRIEDAFPRRHMDCLSAASESHGDGLLVDGLFRVGKVFETNTFSVDPGSQTPFANRINQPRGTAYVKVCARRCRRHDLAYVEANTLVGCLYRQILRERCCKLT